MIRIMQCSICHKTKKANLMLLGKNICEQCEKELVNAKVEDEHYLQVQQGIKEIIEALKKA